MRWASVQLVFIAAFAIVLALITGAIELPATAIGTALIVLAWFVMGFAFYAGLFAVSGSLVSRMEELQNAMVPINLHDLRVVLHLDRRAGGPGLHVVGGGLDPAVLLGAGDAGAHRARVGHAAADRGIDRRAADRRRPSLVPLSGRLYAGAILRTGARVKLRDAWRAARSREPV